MKFATLTTFVMAALGVSAAPSIIKRAGPSEADVLQYALTLENLEKCFYESALAKFDENTFNAAGFPAGARARFVQVFEHESAHVKLLSNSLTAAGIKPVQPCTYNFPYSDVRGFSALSQLIEGVGVSAYAGAAQYIKTAGYLTAAAAILSTEARHNSIVSSVFNNQYPWSGAFDTPLGLNQVYTLAAGFITSCPSTNAPLPVKAFPALTFAGQASPGATVSVSVGAGGQAPSSIAFLTGLGAEFAPVVNGQVTIPGSLMGTVYAVGTTANVAANVTDETTTSGPAVFEFNNVGQDKQKAPTYRL